MKIKNCLVLKNVYFHFDFNFLSYQASNGHDFGSFWVEAYDGTSQPELKNLWDSLPQRVFLNLSKYKNKDFQIRIIVDDGLAKYNIPGQIFAAFDNLGLDGYLNDPDNSVIEIYPNPTKNEVFIQFSQQPVTDIHYKILDVSGRLMMRGMVDNYRIDVNRLCAGVYFIKFYRNNQPFGNTKN